MKKRRKRKYHKKPPLMVVCRVCGATIPHDGCLGLWIPFEARPSFLCLSHAPEPCLECDNFFHAGEHDYRKQRAPGCYMVLAEERCFDCNVGLMAKNGIVEGKEGEQKKINAA